MPNFESILRAPKKEALDDRWFSRFEEAGRFESYEYFNGDKTFRDAQKAAFMKGEVMNPGFDYPLINEEEWRKKLDALHQLKLDIKKEETNEVVKKSYLWRINEKKAEIRMMLATKKGDLKNFRNMTEFVYGQPDKDVFAYTLSEIHDLCESAKTAEDGTIAQAAMELAAYLPKPVATEKSYNMPTEATIEMARQATQAEFSGLLEQLPIDPSKTRLDANDMLPVCEAAISKLNALVDEDQRWKVAPNPIGIALSASQGDRTLKVPASKTWAVEKVAGLMAHEAGTHVVRRMAGERSKLKLLSLGLDRYDAGEEGVAKMREELINGDVEEFAGMEPHFAASLAVGLDGKPRNFRETYEIMHKLFRLRGLLNRRKLLAANAKVDTTEKTLAKASDDAYARCIRTFRGTDGQQRGVAFTKDMIYREGNIRVWDLIGKEPGAMMRFSVGKFDPANPRHMWILDQLGITEEEDAEADKAL